MAVPALAARAAVVLADDLLDWAVRLGAAALLLLMVPIALTMLGFGGILALFGGLSGTSMGGGPVWGGPATATATAQIPPDQLAMMQQVAASTTCTLPWTVLGAIANIESGFGRNADQFSSAGAYGYGQFLQTTWQSYGGGSPGAQLIPTRLRNRSASGAIRPTTVSPYLQWRDISALRELARI